jgi:hypothetical protein
MSDAPYYINKRSNCLYSTPSRGKWKGIPCFFKQNLQIGYIRGGPRAAAAPGKNCREFPSIKRPQSFPPRLEPFASYLQLRQEGRLSGAFFESTS